MSATFSTPFGELRFEVEMVDVSSGLPKPDPNWFFTDEQGHEHRYDNGYPTLVTVVDATYWCEDCEDEHEDTHLACAVCGEAITPGTIGPSGFREFAPGRTSAWLDGMPISRERYEEIVQSLRDAR